MACIQEIAAKLGIASGDLYAYGSDIAKVIPVVRERPRLREAAPRACLLDHTPSIRRG